MPDEATTGSGDPFKMLRLKDRNVEPTISASDEASTSWIKYPYGIQLNSDPGKILKSIVEIERFVNEGEYDPKDGEDKKTLDAWGEMLKSGQSTEKGGVPGWNKKNAVIDQDIIDYFTKPLVADTRVGCNDAINPYWQFNRDDDIRPPGLVEASYAAQQNFDTSGYKNVSDMKYAEGMGRVYASMYDSQQQILWIEAGVPRFTNLLSYYRDVCRDASVAEAMNSGNMVTIAARVASFLVSAAMWTFFLPAMCLIWIPRWIELATNERITKYYTFKSTMTLYYSMVNTMLQYTAVSMGIHPYTLEDRNYNNPNANGRGIIESLDASDIKSYPGIPEILRNGPDIFKIMNRRSQMLTIKKTEYSTSELLYQYKKDHPNVHDDAFHTEGEVYDWNQGTSSWEPAQYTVETDDDTDKTLADSIKNSASNWWAALKGSILGSGNHVGFKIEKGASFSEDFSNQTGETGLAEKMNSMAAKQKEEQEIFGQGAFSSIIMKSITAAEGGMANVKRTAMDAITDELKNTAISIFASAASFDIGTVLVTGNGFLEIPKVWRSSTMTRSYNFSFKLRSRYGDPVSVFQSIYIPLFMLIALAAPRAIGDSSYTSPFLIRAYCKGMFNIPLGIITNLSITRGSSEFGWSSQFYPLEVTVTVTVEDLSPQLFVSMSDGIMDTFTRNTSMQAYLDTLSALGLRDMCYTWPKMVRKMNTALAVAKSTVFNSTYQGTALGKSRVGKLIAAFVPYKNDRAAQ